MYMYTKYSTIIAITALLLSSQLTQEARAQSRESKSRRLMLSGCKRDNYLKQRKGRACTEVERDGKYRQHTVLIKGENCSEELKKVRCQTASHTFPLNSKCSLIKILKNSLHVHLIGRLHWPQLPLVSIFIIVCSSSDPLHLLHRNEVLYNQRPSEVGIVLRHICTCMCMLFGHTQLQHKFFAHHNAFCLTQDRI